MYLGIDLDIVIKKWVVLKVREIKVVEIKLFWTLLDYSLIGLDLTQRNAHNRK